jgi:hypothetical protein
MVVMSHERTKILRAKERRDLMPAPRVWTEAERQQIIASRDRGEVWDDIAPRFGVHRATLIDAAKKLGVWTPDKRTYEVTASPRPFADRDRNWWPLPPGHEVTWGAITRGTCLEGVEYPM